MPLPDLLAERFDKVRHAYIHAEAEENEHIPNAAERAAEKFDLWLQNTRKTFRAEAYRTLTGFRDTEHTAAPEDHIERNRLTKASENAIPAVSTFMVTMLFSREHGTEEERAITGGTVFSLLLELELLEKHRVLENFLNK